jgi:hypothetical protein
MSYFFPTALVIYLNIIFDDFEPGSLSELCKGGFELTDLVMSGYVILNGMEKCCGEILLSGRYCHLIKSHCQGNSDENLSCCHENFN